jgi:hypothetical protein
VVVPLELLVFELLAEVEGDALERVELEFVLEALVEGDAVDTVDE